MYPKPVCPKAVYPGDGPERAPGRDGSGGRPRDDAREQAILDAAIDLVAEIGYDAMSIEAVAARAKSSKATIYRRWPGKAELVAEAMRRRSRAGPRGLPDTGSLRGDLLALVQRMFDGMNGVDGGLHVRPGRRRPQRRSVRAPRWRLICMSRSCAPSLRSWPGPKPGASCHPASIPRWCCRSHLAWLSFTK